jgi:glycosyl transferase family 87
MSFLPILVRWVLPLGVGVIIGGILFGWDRYLSSARFRGPLLAFACSVSLVFGAGVGKLVIHNMRESTQWDFLAFWIPARAAAENRNFYDPQALHAVAPPLPYDPSFIREVLDVGFLYPASTMLFLHILGQASIDAARRGWTLFVLGTLLGATIVLWRVFLRPEGGTGLLLATTLLFSLRGTLGTIARSQTTFLLLLLLALFWQYRRSWRGGAFLALAGITKPLGAFLLLQPLLRRNWRVVAGVVLTGVLVLAATVAEFGWETVASYSGLSSRIPEWLYREPASQSILATILKLKAPAPLPAHPFAEPVFLTCAILLVGVSVWLTIRLPEKDQALSLALLVPCALLIYPGTGADYSILLMPSILEIWNRRHNLALGSNTIILLLAMTFALVWVDKGYFSVVAYLLMWLVLAYCAFLRLKAGKLDKASARRARENP